LQFIISLNRHSEHPLADATVQYGREQSVDLLKSSDFSAVTGKGVQGVINQKQVAVGNLKMMEHAHAVVSSNASSEAQTFQKQGKTVSFLSVDENVVGFVVIGDKIKKSSAKAIEEIQNQGIDVIMLTGDNHDTAQAVALEL